MLSNMRKDIIELSVAVDSKKNILKIFEFDGYVNLVLNCGDRIHSLPCRA